MVDGDESLRRHTKLSAVASTEQNTKGVKKISKLLNYVSNMSTSNTYRKFLPVSLPPVYVPSSVPSSAG